MTKGLQVMKMVHWRLTLHDKVKNEEIIETMNKRTSGNETIFMQKDANALRSRLLYEQ